MKPEEIGRRFGIGVRVAGRIARQRIEDAPPVAASAPAHNTPQPSLRPTKNTPTASDWPVRQRTAGRAAGRAARGLGGGVAGFLRPFGRVGGILWLEVTGFFFGLFAVGFAIGLWRVHTDYAHGPHHQQFLISTGLTAVFSYLCVSAFWRARKR